MAISFQPPHSWPTNVWINIFLWRPRLTKYLFRRATQPALNMRPNNRTTYMSMMGSTRPISHKWSIIDITPKMRKAWQKSFQEDPFSSDVVAQLLLREDETLADSLFTWAKAVVKTLWKLMKILFLSCYNLVQTLLKSCEPLWKPCENLLLYVYVYHMYMFMYTYMYIICIICSLKVNIYLILVLWKLVSTVSQLLTIVLLKQS